MRNLYFETDLSRIIGNKRSLESQIRRGPHEWVYIGTYPDDPNTTAPFFDTGVLIYGSPEFQNGWVWAGGTFAPMAFRWSTHWELEWQGHVKDGTDGSVMTRLPTRYIPDHDESHITDVDPGGTPTLARVFIDSITGDVTITAI